MKILFYDTKPYDKEFFNKYNKDYGFDIKYLTGKLTEESADLAKGYDVISVNRYTCRMWCKAHSYEVCRI